MQKLTKRKSNSKSKKGLRRKTKTRKSQKGGFVSPKDELLQMLETAKNALDTLETQKNEILENKRKFFNSGRKADYRYNSPILNTPEETQQ